jgi:hypothetical protein
MPPPIIQPDIKPKKLTARRLTEVEQKIEKNGHFDGVYRARFW